MLVNLTSADVFCYGITDILFGNRHEKWNFPNLSKKCKELSNRT